MTVQALCDRRQSEGLLSEEGVFVSVTEVAVAGGETVTAKLSVTFDDTGHHSTPTATLSLDDKGQLVCRHEDNR